MMERYGCEDIERHRAKHRRLIEQATSLQQAFNHKSHLDDVETARLLRNWVVNHILADDRRLAQMLNDRGVY